jgi:hypothetical protein
VFGGHGGDGGAAGGNEEVELETPLAVTFVARSKVIL